MDEERRQADGYGTSPWAPRVAPEEPVRPGWLDAPLTPPLAETPAGPPPPLPPSPPNPLPPEAPAPPRARRDHPGWLKPALAGGIVGALVAAAVAGGLVAATDDGSNGPGPAIARASSRLAGEQLDVAGVLRAVEQGVVSIEVQGLSGDLRTFRSAGTGMIIEPDGLVLTNAHVVRDGTQIKVVLFDGRRLDADLVGSSPSDDVALVRIRGVSGLEVVEFGSSRELQVGDDVVAVGNALNLGATPTVTTGIVSALNREIDDPAQGISLQNLVQTDAAINQGNSGGPIVNAAGEVIGINTAVAAQGQNIGFAISIDSARPLIERLRQGGGDLRVTAFLGIRSGDVADVNEQARERFRIERDDGAFVTLVIPGSGADGAGLQPGDVIVSIDGRRVRSAVDVGEIVRSHEPGDEVEIRYEREGEQRTARATLGSQGVSGSGG